MGSSSLHDHHAGLDSPVRGPGGAPRAAECGDDRQTEDNHPTGDERSEAETGVEQSALGEHAGRGRERTDDADRDHEQCNRTERSLPVHTRVPVRGNINSQDDAPPTVCMTTIVVLADPKATLPGLDGVLAPETRRRLARAMLVDVCATIQHGEADVLVNHPERDGAESALRELLADELPDPGAVRYEPQVGSDRAARLGNALSHLLESEDEPTVGFAAPTAPFLRREHVGTLAMKLRTSDVVLGPAPGGGVSLAGLASPVAFDDALGDTELLGLTRAGLAAGLDVDFLAMTPRVETTEGLATAVALATARHEANRGVPPRTAALFEELELSPRHGATERSDSS